MNPYIPNTEENRNTMLKKIGVSSVDELFSSIPGSVVLTDSVPFSNGDAKKSLTEEEVRRFFNKLGEKNLKGTSFLGFGSYEHIIPSAVGAICSLPSFVTAYTPYQPEISQGVLQSIFEYQTMICEITGMDVSNASLYDGASACAEAAALAISDRRHSNEIIISETLHPYAAECVKTWAFGRGHEVKVLPQKDGVSDFSVLPDLLNDKTAVVILQTPNRYGNFENLTGVADIVHNAGALLAVSSDPMSLALQKSQAQWNADIALGDTQVLGIPVSFGGPGCGYMAVKQALMRKIAGRIVGKTVDSNGDTAYVLTLQAREQHIKRERATSNICSNEALMALTSAVYLSTVGWDGLHEAAMQSYQKAHYLASLLTKIKGISLSFPEQKFWCEFAVEFDNANTIEHFSEEMKKEGIFCGVKDGKRLLIAVTEKRTREEIDKYAEVAGRIMK